jgi:hypothetical protein
MDGEGCALVKHRINGNFATMRIYGTGDNRQADACAGNIADVTPPMETI